MGGGLALLILVALTLAGFGGLALVASRREREVREMLTHYEDVARRGGRLAEGHATLSGEVEAEGDTPVVSLWVRQERRGGGEDPRWWRATSRRVEARAFVIRVGEARVRVSCDRPRVIGALEPGEPDGDTREATLRVEPGERVIVEGPLARRSEASGAYRDEAGWAMEGDVLVATAHLLTLVRTEHGKRSRRVTLAGAAAVVLAVGEAAFFWIARDEPSLLARGVTAFVALASFAILAGPALAPVDAILADYEKEAT